MTRERIEDFREVLLPFMKKRLLAINYENRGKSDAEEFEKDFNEICDLAIKALEQEPTTKNDLGVTNEQMPKIVTIKQLEDMYDSYDKSLWREHEDIRGDDMVEMGTALQLLQEELCLLGCWDDEVEE